MRRAGEKTGSSEAPGLPMKDVERLVREFTHLRVVVVGDVMLDHFVWGRVRRISPEAPVPVVEFEREGFMPGGAANVARNLTALGVGTTLMGCVGRDESARRLKRMLGEQSVVCAGLVSRKDEVTATKMRIVAGQQQVARLDRETVRPLTDREAGRLVASVESSLKEADAVIVADYGKGVVTTDLLVRLQAVCRPRGIWMSVDPKPDRAVDWSGLSVLTPNRREIFEMGGVADTVRAPHPTDDAPLMLAIDRVLERWRPGLLLVTMGELGLMLCQRGQPPVHSPTVARDVYDVSGAGDTVIAVFTLAIAAGASPREAAILANHAAGVVVGKFGTATTSADELVGSFDVG